MLVNYDKMLFYGSNFEANNYGCKSIKKIPEA